MKSHLVTLACMLSCVLGLLHSPATAAPLAGSQTYSTPSLPVLDPARAVPPVEIVRVDVGFSPDGAMRNRHVPVRVWLTSREQPFSGTLSVAFPQDATQHARYLMDVSTTPGKITPYEFCAFLPLELEWLEVEVSADNARTSVRLEPYASDPARQLPPDNADHLTVLVIGELPFALSALDTGRSTVDALQKDATAKKGTIWDAVDTVPFGPESMFLCWPNYDAADLVIATADALAAADPRALSALRTWTHSGGRLLIVADNAGPLWQSLWTDATPMALSVSDLRSVRPAESLISLLNEDATVQAGPDLRFSARMTELTPWGAQHGWKTLLQVETAEGASKGTLFAYGPFGGGMVGVLTAEPQRMSKALSAGAAQVIYRHLVRQLSPTARIHWIESLDANSPWNSRYTRDAASQQSLGALIEGANEFPTIGPLVFILISVAMLLMGLLIGPIDGLLTRRKARRGLLTWWTAMGWITLASVIAALAPSLVRSGQTYLNHAQGIDVICDATGESKQWTTDYFATFAGKPVQFGVPTLADGAWCRGISIMNINDGAGTAFSPLLLPISVGQSGEREAHPLPVTQNQWTLRTLLAVSPGTTSSITATILTGDDGPHLKLSGIPEGSVVSSMEVEAMGRVFILNDTHIPAQELAGRKLKLQASAITPTDFGEDGPTFGDSKELEVQRVARLEYLDGFSGRTDTTRRLRSTGTFATAHASITHCPPQVVPSGLDASTTQQVRTLSLRVTFMLSPQAIEVLNSLIHNEGK